MMDGWLQTLSHTFIVVTSKVADRSHQHETGLIQLETLNNLLMLIL